ncbi:Co-chaperone HscB, C-terminal oligomerization domain-containing protein [Endogone sp. FLAS-F59071]|nr:Co-chaperone HscB, C-terminal oligomerization domain-containing protein [Endogone sp. FLAS-F59071]|eukprot:RUS18760.1 Co-chaperone HscB, C-terminal oligomerization domain-containing protein [Endogone sp. FLAS-F59071]
MLQLRNVHIAEAESLEDPELLMEVLEAREELEEVASEEEVEGLKKRNDARIDETVTALSRAFADDNMDEAKTLAVRLQYWENIRYATVEWAPGKRIELAH